MSQQPKSIRDALAKGASLSKTAGRAIFPEERRYWESLRKPQAQPVEAAESAVCPVCDGLGVVRYEYPVGHPGFGKLFPCPESTCPTRRAQEQARYAKISTHAQIPETYRDMTFAKWDELILRGGDWMSGKLEALGYARAFCAAVDRDWKFTSADARAAVGLPEPEVITRARNGIVFSGGNGIGKTSLAISIANWCLDNGHPVVYVRFDDLLAKLQERFRAKAVYETGGDEEDTEEVMSTYMNAPILIIDELTVKKASEWQERVMQRLINFRYTSARMMPTIYTTNTSYETFAETWGMIIGQRVLSSCHWVEMHGRVLRPMSKKVKSL